MTHYGPMDDAAVFALYPDLHISRDNIEHYRALAEGRLLINRCGDCGHWIYPHRPLCPECWSWNVTPREVSGLGRVFMFTLINQLRDSASGASEPIALAAVELVEQPGLRYLARIIECPPDRIAHEMPVRLTWLEEGGRSWPAFAPVTPPIDAGEGAARG